MSTSVEGENPAETTTPPLEKNGIPHRTIIAATPHSLTDRRDNYSGVVAVFGIIRVIGITALAEDGPHAEAIASIKQAEV